MIKLEVEPYCHDCPNFVADVKDVVYHASGEPLATYKKIVCANFRICAGIARYLKSVKEKEE